MRRLDDFLLVKELNAGLLSHCVSEGLLHAAISAPSAGIEYDYERLELLGKFPFIEKSVQLMRYQQEMHS